MGYNSLMMIGLVVVAGLTTGGDAFDILKELTDAMIEYNITCYENGDLERITGCINGDLLVAVLSEVDDCDSETIQSKCSTLQTFLTCFNEKQMTYHCIESATNAIDLLGGAEHCEFTAQDIIDDCFEGTLPVVWPAWSEWGSFSECSVTCDTGVQQRTRTCVNRDNPSEPRSGCPGESVESEECDADQVCSAAVPGTGPSQRLIWSSCICLLGLVATRLNFF